MFFAGIDAGSRTAKAVILDRSGEVVSSDILDSGIHGARAAETVFESCLKKAGIAREDVFRILSTGYGKGGLSFESDHLTEIACHAGGAFTLFPETRTVIDIGGQDSKVILLGRSGDVVDFAMNDRCAAGTGRFLEFMARVLEKDLEEMARTPHDGGPTRPINSLCTVFAESEIVSLLSEGCPVDTIIRRLHASVAERTAALLKRIPFVPPLTMTGGVARNRGVVEALRERVKQPLNIPREPQIVGALGAACAARGRGPAAASPPKSVLF